MKKKIFNHIFVVLLLSLFSSFVVSITLEASFSSGSNRKQGKPRTMITDSYETLIDFYKTSWASTSGYKGKHYVRALVGNDQNDNHADTGRVYSDSDNYAETEWVCYYSGDSTVEAKVIEALPRNRARAYYGY